MLLNDAALFIFIRKDVVVSGDVDFVIVFVIFVVFVVVVVFVIFVDVVVFVDVDVFVVFVDVVIDVVVDVVFQSLLLPLLRLLAK